MYIFFLFGIADFSFGVFGGDLEVFLFLNCKICLLIPFFLIVTEVESEVSPFCIPCLVFIFAR